MKLAQLNVSGKDSWGVDATTSPGRALGSVGGKWEEKEATLLVYGVVKTSVGCPDGGGMAKDISGRTGVKGSRLVRGRSFSWPVLGNPATLEAVAGAGASRISSW